MKNILWCIVSLTMMITLVAPSVAYADGEEGIVDAIAELGKKIVDIIIGIAAVVMAVGIAYKMTWGEFEVAVGNPYGLSRSWTAVAGIVICFIVAALTILFANTIIDLISAHIPSEGIHIPG